MYDKILFQKIRNTDLRGFAVALVLGAAVFSTGCSDSGGNNNEPVGSTLLSCRVSSPATTFLTHCLWSPPRCLLSCC